jgi:hypothetical protein
LPADQLPEDRYFRDAWKLEDGELVIDVEAAKEIQRDVWRKMRKPKLDALDLEFMRAIEESDSARQAEITAEKNALRDVTETELPNDLAAIKTTIPTILL